MVFLQIYDFFFFGVGLLIFMSVQAYTPDVTYYYLNPSSSGVCALLLSSSAAFAWSLTRIIVLILGVLLLPCRILRPPNTPRTWEAREAGFFKLVLFTPSEAAASGSVKLSIREGILVGG